jgi:two-component system C4-dicarboxylate transport sensor histidine kinase DctB
MITSMSKVQQNLRLPGVRSFSGWITLLAFMVVVLFGVSATTYRRGLEELSNEGSIRLQLFVTYLRGVLEKYESLPELLARDKKLVNFLVNPGGRDRIEAFNRYLETINQISRSADTYLMDNEGLTIAASNWQSERPFVGRNFSYRPYFQQAMKGGLGRYFALGTTSLKRGYFFAYPVRSEKEILGAVVIKINIDNVEQRWGYHDETFLVTDPDNVIFITTFSDWRFKTLGEVDPYTMDMVVKSRRYPNSTLDSLPIESVKQYPFGSVINLVDEAGNSTTYLQQTRYMEEAGWNVQILSNIKQLRRRVLETNIMVGSFFLFAYLFLILLQQRRHRLAELKRIEDQARRALQEANERLESRVQERTSELVESNKQLLIEIQERRQTEEALNKTRSELVQAAKMATLGQMSAGINHELNQPLAAIRSYSDNARQLLEKGRTDEASWNLSQIGELTDRMAQLGVQLKEFSRKSSEEYENIGLQGVIDGALEILSPILKKSEAEILVDREIGNFKVRGNQLLL